jgi:hypothetical protein
MSSMAMLPPRENSYWGMLTVLGEAFRERYKRRDVNLTGVLFARPASAFAKKEVLPHIDYWHHRSDNYTDFFCPGYQPFTPNMSGDSVTVLTVGGLNWGFSNLAFVAFLEQFEPYTSWHYGGGCELLVANARYNPEQGTASLDLSSAIAIDLEFAYRDKAFRDVSGLCEAIFQFAKNLNEASSDPCWEFSDQLGLRVVKGSLKEFLLHYLPKWLTPEARKAFYFATRNLEAHA